ncbi:MAG: hypothetical protein KGN01_05305 [Patescibacteria group bacterium]|nr:hypothetical protein [Patescibacteria group bacterium]
MNVPSIEYTTLDLIEEIRKRLIKLWNFCPYIDSKTFDVKLSAASYDYNNYKEVDGLPQKFDIQTYHNNTSLEQSMTRTSEGRFESSISFTLIQSLTANLGDLALPIQLPQLGVFSFIQTPSISLETYDTTTKTESQTITQTFETKVPPHTKVVAKVFVVPAEFEIPFKAKITLNGNIKQRPWLGPLSRSISLVDLFKFYPHTNITSEDSGISTEISGQVSGIFGSRIDFVPIETGLDNIEKMGPVLSFACKP